MLVRKDWEISGLLALLSWNGLLDFLIGIEEWSLLSLGKLVYFEGSISITILPLSRHLSFLFQKEPDHMPVHRSVFRCSRCLFCCRTVVFELVMERNREVFHRGCLWEVESGQPIQNHRSWRYSHEIKCFQVWDLGARYRYRACTRLHDIFVLWLFWFFPMKNCLLFSGVGRDLLMRRATSKDRGCCLQQRRSRAELCWGDRGKTVFLFNGWSGGLFSDLCWSGSQEFTLKRIEILFFCFYIEG